MSGICEIIQNLLRHPNARRISTFISGIVRMIISKLHGVLHVFRRAKVGDDLNLGILHDVDYKEEHCEALTPPVPMEQQEDSDAEETPIYPDTPAFEDKQVNKDDHIFCPHCDKTGDHEAAMCPNKPKGGLMYCTICRNIYPVFCKNQEEHHDKVLDYIFCQECRKIGDHTTAMCTNKLKNRVLVCSVCRDIYPCKNQDEHDNEGVEVENFCSRCYRRGHRVQECPVKEYHPDITFFCE